MAPFLKIPALLFILSFTTLNGVHAQVVSKPDAAKQIAFKISGLTVEEHKLLTQTFLHAGYQVSYSCIPAGIMLIESSRFITTEQQTVLEGELKSAKAGIQYKILEGFTLEFAEQECSSVRNGPYQKK